MDFTLLYYTLVMDNAVPLGYLQDFRSLETPARRAVKRLQSSAASVSDSMASTALIALRRESDHRTAEAGPIADQLVIADMRPKKFRTKWQRAIYDGPTARKDVEAAERDRWIQLLANLLRSTDTPMGKLIREKPEQCSVASGAVAVRERSGRGFGLCKSSSVGLLLPTASLFLFTGGS